MKDFPFELVFKKVVYSNPRRLTDINSWHEHIPFAFAVTEILRPTIFVELGVHKGDSYCAFCQAVDKLGLDTACYGIDTWTGDKQAGYYNVNVLGDLRAHQDPLYGHFSTLMQKTFDAALPYFEDASIDLLHIDGLHTYEAVKHDFESWLPKMSARGVVLFHDTTVHRDDFGVWKLWDEVSGRYPSFEFKHGHGLGMLAVGNDAPQTVLDFLRTANEHSGEVRNYFKALGERLSKTGEVDRLRQTVETQQHELADLRDVNAQLRQKTVALDAQSAKAEQLNQQLSSLQVELETFAERNQKLRKELEHAKTFQPLVAERDRSIETLNAQLRAVQTEHDELLNSKSWRITAPLRQTKQVVLSIANVGPRAKASLGSLARYVYWHLPVSHTRRLKVKDFIFRNLGFLIRSTTTYKQWLSEQSIDRSQNTPTYWNKFHFHTHHKVAEQAEYLPEDWREYHTLTQRISEFQNSTLASLSTKPPKMISVDVQKLPEAGRRLEFPEVHHPLVSIVIPVYNNLKYSIECLLSVQKHSQDIAYEIIVVDDGSTDLTESVLSEIQHIIYVRNSENLGFLRSCNLGASKARGKYLLFLNNDVQVTSKWLHCLVQTFTTYADVGVVGPKIIYPNGRLQEAGARINLDCTSQLVGVGDNPDLERYGYLRDVDYCSGACLLMETQRFHEVGGFDDDLAPAYCEDVDLCFKLRRAGLRILYNPESVIIHHLSVTSDTLDKDYKKQCVVRNQQKLSERWQEQIDTLNQVRVIAFYLPQFHPIPENDRWWGKGFTEWSNVSKARPNFVGHYQPHLPSDLGFYDLRVEEVMEHQAELAQRYGIHGFCYFYYWFKGERMLEMPLERLIKSHKPNLPFCISWANENWTRRWDGLEQEVLMAQEHSDEDDRAVIRDLIRYLSHPNYIRINGKPLLLIYRANLFPDIRRTTDIWREVCQEEGIGEIYLAMVESFEHAVDVGHPSKLGFDASIEYPPHATTAPINLPGERINPDYNGVVSDYRELVMRYVQRPVSGHARFRSVMPSWDNTPRRQNSSYVFAHATPGAFQAWLEFVLAQTREQNFGDERIVFINAWNEWAEGAHMEPDRRFRHGFLEATSNAQDRSLLGAG